mmetsp:Transcript_502/g.866  ORF Transcript_502/g.866 Transcript_502/m.866 type:complete len:200 (-) Transcript_502:381-980(-)
MYLARYHLSILLKCLQAFLARNQVIYQWIYPAMFLLIILALYQVIFLQMSQCCVHHFDQALRLQIFQAYRRVMFHQVHLLRHQATIPAMLQLSSHQTCQALNPVLNHQLNQVKPKVIFRHQGLHLFQAIHLLMAPVFPRQILQAKHHQHFPVHYQLLLYLLQHLVHNRRKFQAYLYQMHQVYCRVFFQTFIQPSLRVVI